ncbi:hypothetical protein NL676_026486 [Syzygium grande]|nr:hypothetical protein NL676_026486 [Syzygium grande]
MQNPAEADATTSWHRLLLSRARTRTRAHQASGRRKDSTRFGGPSSSSPSPVDSRALLQLPRASNCEKVLLQADPNQPPLVLVAKPNFLRGPNRFRTSPARP